MHHGLSHIQEDGFEVVLVGDAVAGLGEVNGARESDEDSADNGQTHPGNAVEAALAGVGRLTQRHEADHDVWLAKVAQAPGQVADDDASGNTGEHGEVVVIFHYAIGAVGIIAGEREDGGRIAERDDCHNWHDHQGDEHKHALDDVRVGHRQEAADEGVEDGHRGDNKHAGEVVATEGGLEVAAAGDHAGGDVEGKEEDNDGCGDDAQQAGLIVQAVFKEGRHGNRVGRDLRVGAQARCDPLPVCPAADEQADGHP